MDGTTLAVAALLAMMVWGMVGIAIAVYAFWENSRMRKLERQMSGILDLVEDWIMTVDREHGQMWTLILSMKETLRRMDQ